MYTYKSIDGLFYAKDTEATRTFLENLRAHKFFVRAIEESDGMLYVWVDYGQIGEDEMLDAAENAVLHGGDITSGGLNIAYDQTRRVMRFDDGWKEVSLHPLFVSEEELTLIKKMTKKYKPDDTNEEIVQRALLEDLAEFWKNLEFGKEEAT